MTHLSLSRLGQRDGIRIVEGTMGHQSLPVEVIETIVSKADGVPLFVEQLTKHVLESDLVEKAGDASGNALRALAIPTTLQDLLTARLDRLGKAKAVAQLAAVIGREVPYGLLEQVFEHDATHLKSELKHLVEAGLLLPRGSLPDATFTFAHALVRTGQGPRGS